MKKLLIFSLGIAYLSISFMNIYHYGVDIPYWDQWDSEAELYIKYLKNELTLSYFFQPHNEHRIALTRLFSLLVFEANGGWNPKVTMYVQAIIPTLSFLLLLKLGRSFIKENNSFIIFSLGLLILMAVPSDFENRFWGFQNQFYFMLFLSILGFYGLLLKDSSQSVFYILIPSILLPFTIALNLIFYSISIPLTFLRIFIQNSNRKSQWIGLLLLQILVVFLELLNWVTVPGHSSLRAQSISSFIKGFFRVLSLEFYPFLLLVFLIPLGLIFFQWVKMENRFNLTNQLYSILFRLGLLGFGYLQFAAFSFGRNGGELASRYQTIYVVFLSFVLIIVGNILQFTKRKRMYYLAFVSMIIFVYIFKFFTIYMPQMEGRKMQLQMSYQTLRDNRFVINEISNSSVFLNIYPNEELVKSKIENPILNPFHKWLIE